MNADQYIFDFRFLIFDCPHIASARDCVLVVRGRDVWGTRLWLRPVCPRVPSVPEFLEYNNETGKMMVVKSWSRQPTDGWPNVLRFRY